MQKDKTLGVNSKTKLCFLNFKKKIIILQMKLILMVTDKPGSEGSQSCQQAVQSSPLDPKPDGKRRKFVKMKLALQEEVHIAWYFNLFFLQNITFSIFSIMTPLTSETWALTLASLFISSGWSTQYCMCPFSFDLWHFKEKVLSTATCVVTLLFYDRWTVDWIKYAIKPPLIELWTEKNFI